MSKFTLPLIALCILFTGCANNKKAAVDTVVLAKHSDKIFPVELPIKKAGHATNIAVPLLLKRWELPLGPNQVVKTHYQAGYMFFTTNTNKIYMVDVKSGKIMWVRTFTLSVSFPVGISKEHVYFSAGDILHDVDLLSGTLLNKIQLRKTPSYGVVLKGQVLCILSERGYIEAFRVKEVIGRDWFKSLPTWLTKSRHYTVGPLTTIKEHLYYSDTKGAIVRISSYTGAKSKADYQVHNGIPFHAPIIDGRKLYALCDNSTLYELDRFSMLPNWIYSCPLPTRITPLLGGKYITVPVINGLHCLDRTAKGKLVFKTTKVSKPLIVNDTYVIGLKGNDLSALRTNGDLAWTQKLVPGQLCKPMGKDEFVIISEGHNSVAYYSLR